MDVEKTVSVDPWKPMNFDLPPYSVVNPSFGYMFTLGSGNMSLATTAYGFQYISGIDVFRHDFISGNPEEPLINVDHYIAGTVARDRIGVFKTPPQIYHWPKPNDAILNYVMPEWKYTINNMLYKSKK